MVRKSLIWRAAVPGAIAISYVAYVLQDQFAAHDIRRLEIVEERKKDSLYEKGKNKANDSSTNFPKA